ncbi:hypothetical protein [Bradyrhizobium neotropicale]|nr:hypothetical protein [Bradyrhizobium neotropicale]
MSQQNEYPDVLPSFEKHNTTAEKSRVYILQCLAKFRASGNALPRNLRIGGQDFDTHSFLASFSYDKREAPPGIAAYATVMQPSMCEVALSLM